MNLDKFLNGGIVVCIKTHTLHRPNTICEKGSKYNTVVYKSEGSNECDSIVLIIDDGYHMSINSERNIEYLIEHFVPLAEYRINIINSL